MRSVRLPWAFTIVAVLALLLASGGLDTNGFEELPGHEHPAASSGFVLLSLAGPSPASPDAEDHETCGASCVSFATTVIAAVAAVALMLPLVSGRLYISSLLTGPRAGPRLLAPPPR